MLMTPEKPTVKSVNTRYLKAIRRRKRIDHIVWVQIFLAVIGGPTGILLGALLVEWIWPGHPFYSTIREVLRDILM